MPRSNPLIGFRIIIEGLPRRRRYFYSPEDFVRLLAMTLRKLPTNIGT
jgi:hypothetical protein